MRHCDDLRRAKQKKKKRKNEEKSNSQAHSTMWRQMALSCGKTERKMPQLKMTEENLSKKLKQQFLFCSPFLSLFCSLSVLLFAHLHFWLFSFFFSFVFHSHWHRFAASSFRCNEYAWIQHNLTCFLQFEN